MTNWTQEDIDAHYKRLGRPSPLAPTRAAAASKPSPSPAAGPGKQPKYRNIVCEVDGIEFDSKKEGRRYLQRRNLERSGAITELQAHKSELEYPLDVCNVKIGVYTADFRYRERRTGQIVIEDCKSPATRTQVYQLRKKLLFALYGIEIKEI